MNTRLSVVIITWNSRRDAKSCLDSVIDATTSYLTEVIVVDNGSTDGTLEILESYGERINLVVLKKNNGVAVARNVGMNMAKGEYIWILDIDTVVNKEAVDGMIDYLSSNVNCGICACRLQSESGDIQDSCRRLPYPEHKIRNLLIGKAGRSVLGEKRYVAMKKQNEAQFYHNEIMNGEPFEPEYVIGACQLFRKTILDEVGFLDERIFYGPEDADFCLRVHKKGYGVIYLPEYHIIHHYNRISNKKIFSRMSFLHLKGLLYFYFKHRGLLKN